MKFAIIVLASAQLLLVVSGQNNLEIQCKDKFQNVLTVEQMIELAEELGSYRNYMEHKAVKKLERCLDEYDSIKELADFLHYNGDVCHPDHIAKMLQYHRNYVLGSQYSGVQTIWKKNKRMTRFFFRRYALHVALMCRQNALTNLHEASKEFTPDDWHHVLPWSKNSHHLESSNEMKNSLTSSNDDVEKMATSLIEYIDTFDKLTQVLSIGRDEFSSSPRTSMSSSEEKVNDDLGVKLDDRERVRTLISTCDKFAVYYEGQVLSVVRLANVGYRWFGKKLNDINGPSEEHRRQLADWIKVAQVCFSLRKYKDHLKMGSEPIVYHDFASNHLASDAELSSNEIIDASAMSTFGFEKSEFTQKLFRAERRLVGLIAKKFGKGKTLATLLKRYQEHFDAESGDRLSMRMEIDVNESPSKGPGSGLIALVFIMLAICVTFGLAIIGIKTAG